MSKRLNGIFNTLARDAATVLGTVIALTIISSSAIAEPITELTPEQSFVAPVSAQAKEPIAPQATPASDAGFSVSAALDAAASQLAGVISPVSHIMNDKQSPRPSSPERDREIRCLAEAVYYEARGEPERGQLAVAEVVANRVDSRAYPNTYCGVVRQRSRNVCQFSWACDGRRSAPRGLQWERANTIAERVYDGWKPNVVGNAMYFHANYVSPSWSRVFKRVARIGTHSFYSGR